MSQPLGSFLFSASTCCVLTVLGLMTLSNAIGEWRARRNGRRVTGTVVDHYANGWIGFWNMLSKANDEYSRPLPDIPIVGFKTEDGQEFRTRSKTGALLSGYAIGQRMTVYYDPRNPKRTAIGELSNPAASLLIGIAFLLIPIVFAICCVVRLAAGMPAYG